MASAIPVFPTVLMTAFFSKGQDTENAIRGGHDEGEMGSCHTCVATEKSLSEEGRDSLRRLHDSGIGFLTAQQLRDKIRSGRAPILINALPAEMFREMRIKGSINIPADQVEQRASAVIPDKDADVVVYCASFACDASIKAGQALKNLGYTHVSDFKGGLKDWQDCKYPMEGSKAQIQ